MAFRKIRIATNLDTETIIQQLKMHCYPIDGTWNTKEFDFKYVTEKTYSCKTKNNTFKLRARKTNQRRQSRPIAYGKILKEKKNTTIRIVVIPHIGSIIAWTIFILLTLAVGLHTINTQNPLSIIPALLLPVSACTVFALTLKYDAKDIEMFIIKALKPQND
jgi:hypothetical protein